MIKNPWFRLYAEFANDPKVQMMSEAMQRRLVMLFCLQCSGELVTLHETLQVTDGALHETNLTLHETKLDEKIAFVLRISDEELRKTKALFIEKGFIDEGWKILNWNKRQYVSDSSLERVRRHRERKKIVTDNAEKNNIVTEVKKKRACNVTVTPPDTDTDTDIKEKTNKKEKSMNGKDGLSVFVSKNEQVENETERIELPTEVKARAAITTYCRSEGIDAVGHQGLDDLIAKGASMQHFVDAVPIAKQNGKSSWAYVLGVVRRILNEQKNVTSQQPKAQQFKKFDALAAANNGFRNTKNITDCNFIDVTDVIHQEQQNDNQHVSISL